MSGPVAADIPKVEGFEKPVDVRTAARFLGISPSLVYAYVERKQIPPLPNDGPRDPVQTLGTGRVAPTVSREWRNQ